MFGEKHVGETTCKQDVMKVLIQALSEHNAWSKTDIFEAGKLTSSLQFCVFGDQDPDNENLYISQAVELLQRYTTPGFVWSVSPDGEALSFYRKREEVLRGEKHKYSPDTGDLFDLS